MSAKTRTQKTKQLQALI